jgi:catechol 2,3-dioxygenase-like lactoylglutathione lyase family enzyme
MSMPTSPFMRTMPVLTIEDMEKSLAFWRDRLGFSAATWGEPPTFAIVQRGTVSFGLATRAVSRNWTAYVYVQDVDRLYGELLALGVPIADPPETRPYNCREFVVDDPDGNMIAFGQVLQPDALGPGLSERVGRNGSENAGAEAAHPVPAGPWTGGCQCGAVRFRVASLGRASHCHCRMCQKAFGAIGGTLVTAKGLEWTRGTRKLFRSSNKVQRGFCGDCGTPLTFEVDGGDVDVAIPAFDRAGDIRPVIQLDHASRLPWFDGLRGLPVPGADEAARKVTWYRSIESRQWPDGET